MSINYPNSLDDGTSLPNPSTTNNTNNPSHAGLHDNENAAIIAVETKIGTGSSTPTNNKVLRGNGTGTSTWAQVALSTDISGFGTGVATFLATPTSANLASAVTDETGSGLLVFGTSPALTTPNITTGIKDANGNTIIGFNPTASAVNYVKITNNVTGTKPTISVDGSDSARDLNLQGKGLAKTVTIGNGNIAIFPYDYVAFGCNLAGSGYGSTLGWTLSSGVVVINGNPISVASASGTVTASKDTYFDILDNGDGTGTLVNTGGNIVANNAASPALASNSIRIGIIVSGASNIASVASVNQGQETKLLPIASSIPYAVTDSLGNLICPRDPQRKILGYKQTISSANSSGTGNTAIAPLSCPIIVPANRKIKISVYTPNFVCGSANQGSVNIWDGAVGGTQISEWDTPGNTTIPFGILFEAVTTPSTTSKTYNVSLKQPTSGTATFGASSSAPGYIKVELV